MLHLCTFFWVPLISFLFNFLVLKILCQKKLYRINILLSSYLTVLLSRKNHYSKSVRPAGRWVDNQCWSKWFCNSKPHTRTDRTFSPLSPLASVAELLISYTIKYGQRYKCWTLDMTWSHEHSYVDIDDLRKWHKSI
jgi:hypothetical protein